MSLLVLLTCAAHQGHYPPRGPGSREKEVGTSTRLRMGASIAHPVNLQRPSSSTHRPPVPGWVVRSASSATGLLLKLGAPLGPRACAHHLRPLPLIHTKELRPELLKFLKHLPIVASRASYLLAAPRTPAPNALEPSNPAHRPRALPPASAPSPARHQTAYLGGLHFGSQWHLQLPLGDPEEQQHGDPENPEDGQRQAASQAPHGPLCLFLSAATRPWGTPRRSGAAGHESPSV